MAIHIEHHSNSVESVLEYKNTDKKLRISASAIGKIIDKNQCPRYSRLKVDRVMHDDILDGKDTLGKNRGWNDFNPLNSILANEGERFESSVCETLEENARKTIRNYEPEDDIEEDEDLKISKNELRTVNGKILSAVKTAVNSSPTSDPIVMLQTPLSGVIREFSVVGYSDVIIIWPEEGNNVTIRVIDIKASWSEKTSHQLQTAAYTTLLRDVLAGYTDQYDQELEYTMEGGIINRESDYTYPDKHKIPKFDLEQREDDIKRMLSKTGEIRNSLTGSEKFENVEYQLDNVCQSCEHREICYADSYDRADIALLGLSRGEQKALREQGIETVHQVADLANKQQKDPTDFEMADFKSIHKDTITELPKDLQLKLPKVSQLAKEILAEIDPEDSNAEKNTFLNTKTGVGRANLPGDDPSNSNIASNMDYPPNKLIKVYLNVQEDYVTDRTVMISASIDAGSLSSDPIQVSKSIENIPTNDKFEFNFEKLDMLEKQLLEEFAEELYKGIDVVGRAIGQHPESSVHFYFYTENEKDRLIDSLKRYDQSNDITDSLRDLLSLREATEQQIYSIVQDEVRNLYNIDQLPESLVALSDRFYPQDESKRVSYEDHTITDSTGKEINLYKEFNVKVFDYKQNYEQRTLNNSEQQTAYVKFRESEFKEDDNKIPFSVGHQGSDIPLEYIWSCDEIDILSADWIEDIKKRQASLLSEDEQVEEEFKKGLAQLSGAGESFRYIHDGNSRRKLEHVEELSKLFTMYLRQMEEGINGYYKDSFMNKPPIDISNLDTFGLDKTFEETVSNYIDMEFNADYEEKHAHYNMSIEERIQTGKSIPVKITNVTEEGGIVHIDTDLAYEDVGFENPHLMASSCRQEKGDWLIGSVLEQSGDTFIERDGGSPSDLEHSPSVTLQKFNTENMTAEFTSSPSFSDDRYGLWRKDFTTEIDDGDNPKYNIKLTPGMYLIIDPQINSYLSTVSLTAIENSENNATNNLIKDLQNETASLQTTQYDNPKDIREFLRWMRRTDDDITFRPNRKQKRFIKDLTSKVHLLQGPPGTGKTSGAIASALAGRIYTGSKQGDSVRTLVTGASHKSIDEVTVELSKLVEGYNKDNESSELANIDIVRLVREKPEVERDNVKYIHYSNENHQAKINRILQQLEDTGLNTEDVQSTLAGTKKHTVILSTPATIHGLMQNYREEAELADIYQAGPELFDIMCVDEASMFQLDNFIQAGAFMSENGQWLIAGDHRQMDPVQKYEWDSENRRNIETYTPHLSTLNYFRYLRGDDLTDFVEEELLENQPVNNGIENTGLEVTYRCHEDVADFLQEWIYQKDDINYRSDQTATIPTVKEPTDAIVEALNPDKPITVIIHDDTKSKQFNPVEAEIASALNTAVPESESTGVVTPHNAQKGYLKSINRDCTVDTVEKFQGGEKDAMFISATVSDPNYLSTESDFIFDPRRLNVAISRMKKKIVVIAPRSLFNFIPDDVELYKNSVIWTGLYNEVEADGESDWSGTISEFTGKNLDLDANVSVYHSE